MRNLFGILTVLVSTSSFAAIDFVHLKGTHGVFKDEYKKFSPVMAFMAQEIYLENVRLRGNYGKPHSQVPPHPYYQIEAELAKLEAKHTTKPTEASAYKIAHMKMVLEQKKKDSARDPLAKLIQHCYLSPALTTLTPAPNRPEDLMGSLTIPQLGRIINYVISQRDHLNEDELIKVIYASPEELAHSDKAESIKKLLRSEKQFWQRTLAQIILDAYHYQDQVNLYPSHVIEHALMALLLHKADSKADVKICLKSMPDIVAPQKLEELGDSVYTKEDWEQSLDQVGADPKTYLNPEIAMLTQAGNYFFNDKIVPLVKQGYAHYVSPEDAANGKPKKTFANCGETALNCLANFWAWDPKTQSFNIKRLERIAKKHNLNIVKLIAFYTQFPTANAMRQREVLDAWAAMVSQLPDVEYNKPSVGAYCDIRSFTANHVTVIAHLVGDQTLTDLATEIRGLHKQKTSGASSAESTPIEAQLKAKVNEFWARLVTIFSEVEEGVTFKVDRVELSKGQETDTIKSKFALTRSDMPDFNVEYRVMGTHGKFLVAKKKASGLFGEAQVAHDDSDDEEDGFLSFSDYMNLENAEDFMTASYLLYHDAPMLDSREKMELREISEHLSSSPNLLSYLYFTDYFFEDGLALLMPAIIDNRLTHYYPLLEKKVTQEVEADHEESMILFAEYELRYPASFLSKYKCCDRIKVKMKADAHSRETTTSEIFAKGYFSLMKHLVAENLIDWDGFYSGISYCDDQQRAHNAEVIPNFIEMFFANDSWLDYVPYTGYVELAEGSTENKFDHYAKQAKSYYAYLSQLLDQNDKPYKGMMNHEAYQKAIAFLLTDQPLFKFDGMEELRQELLNKLAALPGYQLHNNELHFVKIRDVDMGLPTPISQGQFLLDMIQHSRHSLLKEKLSFEIVEKLTKNDPACANNPMRMASFVSFLVECGNQGDDTIVCLIASLTKVFFADRTWLGPIMHTSTTSFEADPNSVVFCRYRDELKSYYNALLNIFPYYQKPSLAEDSYQYTNRLAFLLQDQDVFKAEGMDELRWALIDKLLDLPGYKIVQDTTNILFVNSELQWTTKNVGYQDIVTFANTEKGAKLKQKMERDK